MKFIIVLSFYVLFRVVRPTENLLGKCKSHFSESKIEYDFGYSCLEKKCEKIRSESDKSECKKSHFMGDCKSNFNSGKTHFKEGNKCLIEENFKCEDFGAGTANRTSCLFFKSYFGGTADSLDFYLFSLVGAEKYGNLSDYAWHVNREKGKRYNYCQTSRMYFQTSKKKTTHSVRGYKIAHKFSKEKSTRFESQISTKCDNMIEKEEKARGADLCGWMKQRNQKYDKAEGLKIANSKFESEITKIGRDIETLQTGMEIYEARTELAANSLEVAGSFWNPLSWGASAAAGVKIGAGIAKLGMKTAINDKKAELKGIKNKLDKKNDVISDLKKEAVKIQRQVDLEESCFQPSNSKLECILEGVTDQIKNLDKKLDKKLTKVLNNQKLMIANQNEITRKIDEIGMNQQISQRHPNLMSALSLVDEIKKAMGSKNDWKILFDPGELNLPSKLKAAYVAIKKFMVSPFFKKVFCKPDELRRSNSVQTYDLLKQWDINYVLEFKKMEEHMKLLGMILKHFMPCTFSLEELNSNMAQINENLYSNLCQVGFHRVSETQCVECIVSFYDANDNYLTCVTKEQLKREAARNRNAMTIDILRSKQFSVLKNTEKVIFHDELFMYYSSGKWNSDAFACKGLTDSQIGTTLGLGNINQKMTLYVKDLIYIKLSYYKNARVGQYRYNYMNKLAKICKMCQANKRLEWDWKLVN